jgi:transcriptional antiterminator RfaH
MNSTASGSERFFLWYAVHTKPRQEALAEVSLERLGLQTFSPRLRETRVVRWALRQVTKPLFPGYIFSRFDPGVSVRAVKYAHGVRGIVGTANKPTPVDDEIIHIIKSRLRDGFVQIEPRFQPGDKVMIESGPLRGFVGIFERQMSDAERVVILLETINYQARLVVERSCLKRL